ncbi:hypothetical protein C8R43DRAFT_962587 [Mycena crocata]|nr:hypothetical protein C8R43DRAFT_962587 [Mycena crocata]
MAKTRSGDIRRSIVALPPSHAQSNHWNRNGGKRKIVHSWGTYRLCDRLTDWGHTVSYIYVATQMLRKDRTLVMPLVQHNSILSIMNAELETCSYPMTRLRIIGVGEESIIFGPTAPERAFQQVAEGWLEVLPRLCHHNEHDEWPNPDSIHLDFATGGLAFEHTKRIISPSCKTLLWYSSGLTSMAELLNNYDFAAIAREIYSDKIRRKNRSTDDVLHEVGSVDISACLHGLNFGSQIGRAWNGSDKLGGVVIKCPDIPEMYDYERVAYAAGPPDSFTKILVGSQSLAKVVDGYIVPIAACIEPTAEIYFRDYYQTCGQELFTVGLQAHELCWSDVSPPPPSNERVKSFLDDSLTRYGPKSVLYISFGSLFFPVATPKHMEALIQTLLDVEPPFPFVLALGGKLASLPKELVAQVNLSGKGLVCDFWVEQRAILQHQGTGWFLTHGGYNSVSEALSQGVPLIIWPVGGEQPLNAALLSSEQNPVAIELLQIRTGPQLGPLRRGGTTVTGTVEDASKEFQETFNAA